MQEKSLTEELLRLGKKQLIYQRITGVSFLGILIVMIIAVAIMIPRVTTTLNNVNSVATAAEKSLEQVDEMPASLTDASENLNTLVSENAEQLTEAVQKMAEVDYDGLNTAIQDLQDAVGPMANFLDRKSVV